MVVTCENETLDRIAAEPGLPSSPQYLVEPIGTLRSQGHVAAAREAAERAAAWFEARPPFEAATFEQRQAYGRALFLAGRGDEALRVHDALVEQFPDRLDARAARAFIAVALGDTAQALTDRECLEQRGENTEWQRGVIAGVLGDRELATDLIRRAAETRDWFFYWGFRNSFLYDPLRDYPAFQELMRHKG